MSFKEFDMSEYYNALEEFKKEYSDKIINNLGGMDQYDELIEKCKASEADIAKMAIKQYGSIEKYTIILRITFSISLEEELQLGFSYIVVSMLRQVGRDWCKLLLHL